MHVDTLPCGLSLANDLKTYSKLFFGGLDTEKSQQANYRSQKLFQFKLIGILFALENISKLKVYPFCISMYLHTTSFRAMSQRWVFMVAICGANFDD
jgi:hypothetical protein